MIRKSPQSTQSAAREQGRPLGPLGLAFAAFILIGLIDGTLGVVLPSIQTNYGITTAALGAIFPASTLGYLTAAFSSGPLLERLGRRNLLALGAGGLLLGTLVISFAPPFVMLLVPIVVLGFGLGIIDAGLNAYVAGLPRSTGLLNYLHAFYGTGALLGPLVASAIITARLGWNATYRVWALAAALALLGFLALFAAEPRVVPSAAHGRAHESAPRGGVLRAALRLRVVWLAAAFLFVYVGAEVSVGAWSYTLLTRVRGVPGVPASWMVSGYWLGLTLGRLALGRVANRLGTRWLVPGCLAGVVVGMLAVWLVPVPAMAVAGLWLAGFCFGPLFPSTIALIGSAVPSRLQQSAIGLAASLGSMGSASLPWLAGTLGGRFGLLTLMPYIIALCLAMLALWLALRPALAAPPAADANVGLTKATTEAT
jgi:fucose permease